MTDSSRLQTSRVRPVASRHSESERTFRSILEEQRQLLFSKAHSEILKQGCRAEKAEAEKGDADIGELQRQVRSNRVEIGHTYKESRRERAQLDELSLQERALRETGIRGIQEVEELKRAQERQNCDEPSRQKLRENQSTIDELTAQISELQERLIYIDDSREFQGVAPVCSGRSSHVLVHQQ